MTGINMHLPPPNVTGIAIPGNLTVTDGQSSKYKKIRAIHQQAQAEIAADNKKYKNQNKHKTPGPIKALGVIIAVALTALGVKKLIKK